MKRSHRLTALLVLAVASIGALAQAAGGGPTTHTVQLFSLSFSPNSLTIDQGDTVDFVWVTGVHNVESGVDGDFDGAFSSGSPVSDPNTFSVTFDGAFLAANPMPGNVYDYYCIVHLGGGMTGTITVTPGVVPTLPTEVLIGLGALFALAGTWVLRRQLGVRR